MNLTNHGGANAPKYQRIAESIESDLRGDRWPDGKLPSVRDVAEQYHVSIVTASRAMQVVRDKGLIQTLERSGSFAIPATSNDRYLLILRVTSGETSEAVRAMVRDGFEQLIRRDPIHLVRPLFDLHLGITLEAVRTQAKAAVDAGIHGVFLLPSRASEGEAAVEKLFLDACQTVGLPVVLIERKIRGQNDLRNDLATLDDVAAGALCTQHLIDRGRKRIGLALASPTSSHQDRLAGYLYALHTARMQPGEFPEHVFWLPSEAPSDGCGRTVAEQIIERQLDGIICYHDYIAQATLVELEQLGIRVPEDVAVVGFENMPSLDGVNRLTSYEYPAERLAEVALRLMRERRRSPNGLPIRVLVPGELRVRDSSGPVVPHSS